MGKKQHQSDKLYLTASEWKHLYGGKKDGHGDSKDLSDYRRLPLDHCSLSLQPYENPYCDEDGNIFDLAHIVPYIKKHKSNPVTGKLLEARMLTKLNFHKNSKGEFHCPVMFKVLNNNVHVAAIKTTGNVYAYEAVEEMNIKTKNWKDLLNDEPFVRNDIIVLQDPKDYSKFNLAKFHHIKNSIKLDNEELERAKTDPKARLKSVSNVTRDVLNELDRTYKAEEKIEQKNEKADKFNAAPYSTGKVAASFTSTAMNRETVHEAAIIEEDIVRYSRVKKKGYVRLVTNYGPLNLELHCDLVPKACENFMKLCQKDYYNGTVFHRLIKHFMVQGGDPTGTGEGGESFWKTSFPDEFKPNLSHTGRGILSMANSGPNTNKSQFFITFRSCKHLDGKHLIFGRIVGGAETTLSDIENVETDNKDKPIDSIIIQKALVFVDPFTEADEALAEERRKELNSAQEKEEEIKEKKKDKPVKKVYSSGVGKFINPNLKKEARKTEGTNDVANPPKKKKTTAFNDFSSW